MKAHFKIIVIGSGPGGSIPGSLFAKKGEDVLMMEEGSDIPFNPTKHFSAYELQNKYKNAGMTMSFGNNFINYGEGFCVGGGSEVNSGLYHRLPSDILDGWNNLHEINCNKADLAKHFDAIEQDLSISYMPAKNIPIASTLLQTGSEKLGWKCAEIPRLHKYEVDDEIGKKQTMSETYIKEFLKNGGTLLANTKVIKISKGARNLNIVSTSSNDGKLLDFTCDYLFIACGAINTPFLLQKSGIKKNVGTNLKLHPSFKFTAMFDDDVNFHGMGVPVHQISHFHPRISMGCSISSKQFLALNLNETGNLEMLKYWQKIATYYSMICPSGSGSISTMPFSNSPLVRFNLSKNDIDNLYKSIYLLAEVLFAAGAIRIFPSIDNEISFSSLSELNSFKLPKIHKLNLMTIHLFSSMRMGGSKEKYSTNPEGQLWQDQSIYISDASILCDSPTVNPQGTVMAFARMNAINFIEEYL